MAPLACTQMLTPYAFPEAGNTACFCHGLWSFGVVLSFFAFVVLGGGGGVVGCTTSPLLLVTQSVLFLVVYLNCGQCRINQKVAIDLLRTFTICNKLVTCMINLSGE